MTMTESFATRRFSCVGRVEQACAAYRAPDRYRRLFDFTMDRRHAVQGAGLSLSGASFGDGVLVTSMRRFNRVLAFDPAARTLRVEPGITLGEIFTLLQPHGLSLPVQPGYPGITIGGCVAGNVHGKNQYREGIFADAVRQIDLFHPAHGRLRLSHTENPQLFELTCGGFGLTGLIVEVELTLQHTDSTWYRLSQIPVNSLAETASTMLAMKDDHDILYSWNDLYMDSRSFGGGFVLCGTKAQGEADYPIEEPARLCPGGWLPPFNFLKGPVLGLANTLYAAKLGRAENRRLIDAYRTHFPFSHWRRYFDAYGRSGCVEHQVIIRVDVCERYFSAVERLVRSMRVPVGLATLKVFRGQQKLLWFRGDGLSFAIHVPGAPEGLAFLGEIDRIDREYGALPNILKDSRLPAEAVRHHYGEFEWFRDQIRAHDPKRMFTSMLAERLGL